MLDIRLIRENPDLVRQAVSNRNDTAPVDDILELDALRRKKVGELDALRQERKSLSKQREAAQERGRELRTEIQAMEEEVRRIDADLEELLLQVPNIPQEDVPIGPNDTQNVQVRTWGEKKQFDFEPLPHWTIGENLDIIDFERGVKISGSRFYVLKGLGARLQRAVITCMLDIHTRDQNYREIYPPSMVKKECMVGSAQLPKFIDNIYFDSEDDMWFIGTAEIPLTNLHRTSRLTTAPIHRGTGGKRCPPAKTPGASSAATSSIKWRCTSS